jgi:hypothetical protein
MLPSALITWMITRWFCSKPSPVMVAVSPMVYSGWSALITSFPVAAKLEAAGSITAIIHTKVTQIRYRLDFWLMAHFLLS